MADHDRNRYRIPSFLIRAMDYLIEKKFYSSRNAFIIEAIKTKLSAEYKMDERIHHLTAQPMPRVVDAGLDHMGRPRVNLEDSE